MTSVATTLPMQFVTARPSLITRSMPMITAMPTAIASGVKNCPPKACNDAASVTSPAPVIPAAPLDVRTISSASPIWALIGSDSLPAWMMNSAPRVR